MVDLPDYSPPDNCRPAARITVGDNRLPIINDGVSTQIRKDGPTDISRYSEVYFPAQWDGEDYSVLFEPASDTEELLEIATQVGLGGTDFAAAISEPLTQEGEGLDEIVDVEYLDHVNDEYVLAQRGYVGGIGGGSGSANELRLSVNDPSKFLGMPASYSMSEHAAYGEMFEYIRDTVRDNQPIFNDIPIVYRFDEGYDIEGAELSADDLDILDTDVSVDDEIGLDTGELAESQLERGIDTVPTPAKGEFQFSQNRHTIADIINKIVETAGFYVWFEPIGETISLIVTNEPHEYFTAHSGGDGNEDIDLRENDALYQLSPVNAIEVRGAKNKRHVSTTYEIDPTSVQPTNQIETEKVYPYATIQHDKAVERAGGRITQQYDSESESEDGVIADGKRELKSRMDSTGRGSMTAEISPQMKPLDVLAARPVCGDVAQNVPILSWEIENLTHTASTNQRPSTELQVSPTVRNDDLTVVESGYKEP